MSAPAIKVRAYNVRFGDCILVSIGTGAGEKHALFDFGNAPAQVKREGGKNDVFAPIAKNVKSRTNGVLDLLVVTHEHLDHLEGFYSERKTFDAMTVRRVWMSLMSKPGYYNEFKKAKPQEFALQALGDLVTRWQRANRFHLVPRNVQAVVANNNLLELSNQERVTYLRGLGVAPAVYLSRGRQQKAKDHGLGGDVTVDILAPESDASVYYAKLPGHTLGLGARLGRAEKGLGRSPRKGRGTALTRPPHMAADEFDRLKDEIAEIDIESVFAIDKAANNTSLVVRVKVGNKVLLFSGDAEEESWVQMAQRNLLGPVDLLKVAHHGSVNGMPFAGPHAVIQTLLKPGKKTTALVSTCRGVYGESEETEIPSHVLMSELSARCKRVVDTEKAAAPGDFVDFEI